MSDATEMFEYNAPTYVDFAKGFDESEDDVDKFFDLMTAKGDSQGTDLNSTVTINSNPFIKVEEEFCTPGKHSTPEPVKHSSSEKLDLYNADQENLTPNYKVTYKTPNPEDGRRSRVLFEALEGLCITGSLKTHKMVTRKDPRTPLLELRSRTVPRNINFQFEHGSTQSKIAREIIFEDETDNLASQISSLSVNEKTDSVKIDTSTDTRSVLNNTVTILNDEKNHHSVKSDIQTVFKNTDAAENYKKSYHSEKEPDIQSGNDEQKKRKFQDQSPNILMHGEKYISLENGSVPSNLENRFLKENLMRPKQIKKTLPKTPNLQTKTRVRQSNILSHSQQEEILMKELRENQPKALPIPKGLFKPPKLGVRRIALPKYNFSTNISEALQTQQVNKIQRKVVNFIKDDCVKVVDTDEDGMTIVNKEVGHRGVGVSLETDSKFKNRRVTKPQPFSFYEGDVKRLRKKEEKIKQIIQEEKKLAEFHANPLPRFVLKAKKQAASSHGSLNTTTCSHSSTCSGVSEQFVFKAKSPVVLHQKPFIPRKSMKPCSQVLDFTLHTEERSHQRELFENTKKQRELEMLLYLQEREREQREREEVAYRMARKSTVHKPLPLPKFK